MSKLVSVEIPVITLTHQSGLKITSLLGDLETHWLNINSHTLARRFKNALQSKLLDSGANLELLRYAYAHPPTADKIQVTVPASDKRFEREAYDVELDILRWQLPSGEWLAIIPAMGIANVDSNVASLKKRLTNTVLLEYVRSKRTENQHSLLSTQWYSAVGISNESIEFEFLTPAEISAISKRKKDSIVARTARRMICPQQAAVDLNDYVDEMSRNLIGDYRQSVLIVGPSGSGKTALIHEFIRQHRKDLSNYPWQTTASQLLRILTEDGGWQHALGQWVAELRQSSEIMYIGNLAELFEVGQYSGNSISIAEALRDTLQRNEMLIIAEITEEQLEKIELKSPGYTQLFYAIRFAERTAEKENSIAESAVQTLAEQFKIRIAPESIKRVCYLQRRYAPYSGYPGKTIRFFEALALQAYKTNRIIDEQDAISAFCEESGMPLFLLDPASRFDTDNAYQFFKQRIIGQQPAIDEVINGLVTIKSGMARSGKPITSALFVGPTGVGKTQMAKTLAEYMFGDDQRMIRLDMSEYSDAYSVSRLTAANEASLVTKVRQQPFSIVLFDEIEKADYSFFDLLLQVLDEGRLTDDRGGVANFCASIIIMTSNIGAQDFIAESIGFSSRSKQPGDAEKHFADAVTRYFRPELFNRLDLVVPFASLNPAEQHQVLQKELAQLKKHQGIISRPLKLDFDDEVATRLTQTMMDSKYGARAVQRIVQQELISPLASELSMHNQDTPLSLSIRTTDNRITFDAAVIDDDKKTALTLSQLADDTADFRTKIQDLADGSTWIGILSDLDRLENKKRHQEKKFWLNPELVARYDTLSKLNQTQEKLMTSAFELEEDALGLLQEDDAQVLVDDFSDMLTTLYAEFRQHLVQMDSIRNPEHNNVVIAVYGDLETVRSIVDIYTNWIAELNLEAKLDYILFQKTPVAKTDTAVATEVKTEANDTNVPDSENQHIYILRKDLIDQPNYMQIGLAMTISAPSVALYFLREPGIYKYETDSEKKISALVDIQRVKLPEYLVPQGIHLKKFYQGKKPVRFIRDAEFIDKRYGFSEYTLMEGHPDRLRQVRQEHLEQSLLYTRFKDIEFVELKYDDEA